MTIKKTDIDKAEEIEEKKEEKRVKLAKDVVGCLVHFYPAPAEAQNETQQQELEKARREADPIAAIITSVQEIREDEKPARWIVNLQAFFPGGDSPAFGVDLVDDGKGQDGTPFCILISA